MVKTKRELGCTYDLAFEDGHDVFFTHHEQLLAIDLDLGAGILTEQHTVADFYIHGSHCTAFKDFAVAHCHHFTPDGLLSGGIRDNDATSRAAFFFDATDDDDTK